MTMKAEMERLQKLDDRRPDYLFKLAHLHEQRFDRRDEILDVDQAIANQKAGLELLPDDSPQKPYQFFVLARLYEERFDKDESHGKSISGRNPAYIENAIISQKAGLELLPNDSVQKPNQLFELARMYERCLDGGDIRRRDTSDLNNAIANQKAGLELLPGDSPEKPDQFFVLAWLYEERYDKDESNCRSTSGRNSADFQNAIANQKAGLELLSNDSAQKPNQLLELARLYKRCSDGGDIRRRDNFGLDNAIAILTTGIELLPADSPEKSAQFFLLARLYEERFDKDESHGRSISRRNPADLEYAIANQKVGLELLPNDSSHKPNQLFELARLYKRCLDGNDIRHQDTSSLNHAIANQKAGLELLPDNSPQKPNHFFVLVRLYEERFDKDESNGRSNRWSIMWGRNTTDLQSAIANQKAGLELLPDDSAQRPGQLFELVRLYKRSSDAGDIRHWYNSSLDNAIANQKTGIELLPADSPERPDQLFFLARLYEERFGKDQSNGWSILRRNPADLENAIANQKAGIKLLSNDSAQKPDQLLELARLYERRLGDDHGWRRLGGPCHTPNLDNAIANRKAGLQLLSDFDPQKLTQVSQLAHLYERRSSCKSPSHQLQDIKDVISNHKVALKLLPHGDPSKLNHLSELVRLRAKLNELNDEVKQSLLRDLRQLTEYMKKPKSDTNIPYDLMENVIEYFNGSDADILCGDIRSHSIRLSAYCEALRSQAGRGTDHDDLRVLYEEIIATERRISTAHKNLAQRYEKVYTVWRTKREQISSMLPLLDSVDPQNYIKGIRTRIQQVDEGFEKICKELDDQGRALKDYFDACKTLLVSSSSSSKGGSPLGPVAPDNPDSVIKPPDPVDLPKAVEAGKDKLSQVRAVVGKARYTKSRKQVEKRLSVTVVQLEELHRGSKEYESEVQDLAVSQPQPLRQVQWWNRRRGPYHQLQDLVKSMRNRLTEIQRGFDKAKQAMLGLIYRPLGDVIDDLRPYLSQGNLEVVAKRLHPDMALYEAAFRFLLENVSQQYCQAEQINVLLPS
ncbi:hypothetical protein FRC16_002581, partial [Serendipita sp. 398]